MADWFTADACNYYRKVHKTRAPCECITPGARVLNKARGNAMPLAPCSDPNSGSFSAEAIPQRERRTIHPSPYARMSRSGSDPRPTRRRCLPSIHACVRLPRSGGSSAEQRDGGDHRNDPAWDSVSQLPECTGSNHWFPARRNPLPPPAHRQS